MDQDGRILDSEKQSMAYGMAQLEEAQRVLMTDRYRQEQQAGYHGPSFMGPSSSGAMGQPFDLPIQFLTQPQTPKRQSLALGNTVPSSSGSMSYAPAQSSSSGSMSYAPAPASPPRPTRQPANFQGHTERQWMSSSTTRDHIIDQLLLRGADLPPGINIQPRQPGYIKKEVLVEIMLTRNDYLHF